MQTKQQDKTQTLDGLWRPLWRQTVKEKWQCYEGPWHWKTELRSLENRLQRPWVKNCLGGWLTLLLFVLPLPFFLLHFSSSTYHNLYLHSQPSFLSGVTTLHFGLVDLCLHCSFIPELPEWEGSQPQVLPYYCLTFLLIYCLLSLHSQKQFTSLLLP